ncbi:5-(carboxyamino)imidazole ribonucleotide mutase [Alkaliphilus hydrothermalis]|uniref:N5-carboxyaminoimidazole ribonucleotide mutase n=1 Tax=Alkaliphilus hydrothermalis TaxID=1482730 RepID=A0ABS2NST0_9FIRM|nr:5-(carboxyamino)imidazole ribonucleotide mutase [Alkaliphilus hydrothermalis]MBM7616024.1 5-(carboxyamino)imidazole ribonucleotide mutase [Alkaliphilus hydrothermalis]
MENIRVGIIMGSDSDLPIMKDAAEMLDLFNVSYECTIVSAHRTPERMFDYAKEAEERGIKVIIAGAGGAAHLPGMVASLTNLPVIGVPVKSRTLDGLDSLYSIVQMPPGIPVATVAINGSKNAGILAAEIIALMDEEVKEKLRAYKKGLKEMVEEKAERLEEIGYEEYLK